MPAEQLNVLLIEDNPGDARLIQLMLDEASGEVDVALTRADRLSVGLERLQETPRDVVLLDLSLPDSQGFDTFTRLHEQVPSVPIVVMSGLLDEELAVRAVHAGAQDYLVKGQVNGHVLVRALRYAVERQHLEQQRAELERQQQEFFTSISHDLRTPLAAIKASISVLLANPPEGLAPPLQRLFRNIDIAADEMSALVEDILTLARLQAGRVELWLSQQDLRDLVTRAARAIEPLVAARQQHLEVHLPDAPVLAQVDAERLGRVLSNLLGNAQKYGRDNGFIRVTLEPDQQGCHLMVADNGPGIPVAEREHIFERFYRLHSETSGQRLGSGLGLSIARAIVDLHGGRIWVDGALGQGATFHVSLPTNSSTAAEANPASGGAT